jgi:hypothetical protein
MRYAIIDNLTKVVLNLIKWDGVTPFTPPDGTSLVNVTNVLCDIGWIEQPDGSFAPPVDESLES